MGGVFRYDAMLPMGQDFTFASTLYLREKENEKALRVPCCPVYNRRARC